MKKNIAVLLLAVIPILTNAYTVTIHNNSSVKIKVKEVRAWCFKISPRRLILNAGEIGVFNYVFDKNYDDCMPDFNNRNLTTSSISFKGYAYSAEDPELESFDYGISYYKNEYDVPIATCKPYSDKIKECLWNSMSDPNKEYAPYKLTADFDSITISDK